jgi:hypothetical protein
MLRIRELTLVILIFSAYARMLRIRERIRCAC